MGKITFRADDDLLEELEAFDASKSEVLREALRAYLGTSDRIGPADADRSRDGRHTGAGTTDTSTSIDDLVRECVDERLEQRLDDFERRLHDRRERRPDVDVTVSLEGIESAQTAAVETAGDDQPSDRRRSVASDTPRTDGASDTDVASDSTRTAASSDADAADRHRCSQCGEAVDIDHVYCPNCGEKASRRLFCECGDEIRSDWAFCPGCGRRTPAADVLESG
ncbi:double zinc ribbon domain-containing protein [Natrialbaceae archaeon AArc-T1-2]|uniref:double zinc ribbon domain-containing protein n=1 Tax=Natrialbaceae archaeon AArc-T1-2 TaxID=3053904 RepID=UPI00255AC0D1|nr:zinc ribbon domain-containing protein [Natrialbaceae archaeon AArc-T1-2]WIV68649.1 zinc ribbon domain-containing protein [Natrialbaceae archaeon AArc-T1-2]